MRLAKEPRKRQADDTRDEQSGTKRSKHTGADLGPSTAVFEGSQSQLTRPSRMGAGSGGRVTQLERIGAAIEAPKSRKSRTTLADGAEANPFAPIPAASKGKKKVSSHPAVALTSLKQFSGQRQGKEKRRPEAQVDSALLPHFHKGSDNHRFGFHVPAISPELLPQGKESKNSYVSEQRTREHRMVAQLKDLGPQTSALPGLPVPQHPTSGNSSARLRTSGTQVAPASHQRSVSATSGITDLARQLPHLACTSRAPSPYTASRPSHTMKGYSTGDDDDVGHETLEGDDGSGIDGGEEGSEHDDEEGSGEDDEPRAPRNSGFFSEVTHRQTVRHTSLPPDHEFTYSRDEDDGDAAAFLLGGSGPREIESDENTNAPSENQRHRDTVREASDVLDNHHRRNGQPHAPDPSALMLHAQSGARHRGQTNPAPGGPVPLASTPAPESVPHRHRRARDQPPLPTQIGHYTPIWKDCLEEAKVECRTIHALSNPWPNRLDIEKSIMESLTTVVVEWNQRGVRFEPGVWPDRKLDMAKLLYEDMSTWRSEMKKAAVAVIPLYYALAPARDIQCPDPIAFAENAATALLQQSMFLRDGHDENGKTKNFAHPALKEAITKFFYTGSYRIAHQRPDVFRVGIPKSCLAAMAAAFNCVFDGYSKNGARNTIPKFSSKSYLSVYHGMLTLVERILEDGYHGPRLNDQLGRWAREGWAALQRVDQSVQRHDHLQVALD